MYTTYQQPPTFRQQQQPFASVSMHQLQEAPTPPPGSFLNAFSSSNDVPYQQQGLGQQQGQVEGEEHGIGGTAGDGVFEFTKRKRWQHLLISELAGTVILALLPLSNGGCKVIGSSNAIKDFLGYSIGEVEGKPLSDLVHEGDFGFLINGIHNSIGRRDELNGYYRFRLKNNYNRPFVLLEVRGQGYWDDTEPAIPIPSSSSSSSSALQRPKLATKLSSSNLTTNANINVALDECRCFLLTARRYPSKSIRMLNGWVEEQFDNVKKLDRLQDLGEDSDMPTYALSATNDELNRRRSQYTTPGIPSFPYPPASSEPQHQQSYTSRANSPAFSDPPSVESDDEGGHTADESYGPSSLSKKTATIFKGPPQGSSSKAAKKRKGVEGNYVCVTCGRTDSPEWRKGPMGPKTLCNACGLRYSKKMKDNAEAAGLPIPDRKGSGAKKKAAAASELQQQQMPPPGDDY